MATASVGLSVAIAAAMDVILLAGGAVSVHIAIAALLFSMTVLLLSGVGATIEWRRPGHAIGRLLMLSGPLYAFLGMSWLTGDVLEPLLDPGLFELLFWGSSFLSWPGVAIIVAWIPLLFPTGTLPGPRWRGPAAGLTLLFLISLLALAAQTSPRMDGTPAAAGGDLAVVVSIELLAMVAVAAIAVVSRYRSGDGVARAQIRWFGAAVSLCLAGFAGTAVQAALQPDADLQVMLLVFYTGILAMPIAIGVAVTRYRLYEIDRLISRTIGWAIVTGALVAVFAGLVVGFQAVLPLGSENTLVVAVSTLVAFALFQPLRRRVQHGVDRRFDRARYDRERVAAAFADRLRDRVDLAGVERDLAATVGATMNPTSAGVWLRGVRS